MAPIRETVKGYYHRARIVDQEACPVCKEIVGRPCKAGSKKRDAPHMVLDREGVVIAPPGHPESKVN